MQVLRSTDLATLALLGLKLAREIKPTPSRILPLHPVKKVDRSTAGSSQFLELTSDCCRVARMAQS